MSLSMTDEQLITLARDLGKQDGELSSDESRGMKRAVLEDLAEDAWFLMGWLNFEAHPKLANNMEVLNEKAAELKLSEAYSTAFIAAAS